MNFALCTKCIHFAIASQSRALFKWNVIIHICSHMLYSLLFAYPLTVNNFITLSSYHAPSHRYARIVARLKVFLESDSTPQNYYLKMCVSASCRSWRSQSGMLWRDSRLNFNEILFINFTLHTNTHARARTCTYLLRFCTIYFTEIKLFSR